MTIVMNEAEVALMKALGELIFPKEYIRDATQAIKDTHILKWKRNGSNTHTHINVDDDMCCAILSAMVDKGRYLVPMLKSTFFGFMDLGEVLGEIANHYVEENRKADAENEMKHKAFLENTSPNAAVDNILKMIYSMNGNSVNDLPKEVRDTLLKTYGEKVVFVADKAAKHNADVFDKEKFFNNNNGGCKNGRHHDCRGGKPC